VSIIAYDYLFHLDRHTVSIDWEILGCGEHKLPGYQPQGTLENPTQCGPLNVAVDIYLNDASKKVLSYDPNSLPLHPIHGPLLIQDLTSFRTEHELHPYGNSVGSYTFHVFAFAIDPATNLSLNITKFTLADSLDGITSRGKPAVVIPVYGTNGGSTTVGIEPKVLAIEYRPRRSSEALQMYTFVAYWIVAFVSAYGVSLVAMTKGRFSLRRLDFVGSYL